VSSIYDAIYIVHNNMKMKNKIPHCRQKQFQNQIRKSFNRGKIDTPNTQIHDRSLPWLSTGTSIKKSGGVKLELWTQHPL